MRLRWEVYPALQLLAALAKAVGVGAVKAAIQDASNGALP